MKVGAKVWVRKSYRYPRLINSIGVIVHMREDADGVTMYRIVVGNKVLGEWFYKAQLSRLFEEEEG